MNCIPGNGIGYFQAADPGDRPAQAYEVISVQFVCSSKAVYYVGNRLSGFPMSFVMSELVILDNGSVFIFSFGCS